MRPLLSLKPKTSPYGDEVIEAPAMKKISLAAAIKVVCIDLVIILLSGLIGVSLNKSFVKGKQQTSFVFERSNGRAVFGPIASAPESYPVFAGIALDDAKEVMESGEMDLLGGGSHCDFEGG